MPRKTIYLEVLDSIPEPATLMEIQFQATMLYGGRIKASTQSVRSSIERFVILKKATKLTDADGKTRYWITGKPINPIEHIKGRIKKLRSELSDLEKQLRYYLREETQAAEPEHHITKT